MTPLAAFILAIIVFAVGLCAGFVLCARLICAMQEDFVSTFQKPPKEK